MHRENYLFDPHTLDDDNIHLLAHGDDNIHLLAHGDGNGHLVAHDGDDNRDLLAHDYNNRDILADVFSSLNRTKPDEITKSNLELKQAPNKERGGILIKPHGSESGNDFGFKTNLQNQNPVVGGINLLFDEDNTDPLSMYV